MGKAKHIYAYKPLKKKRDKYLDQRANSYGPSINLVLTAYSEDLRTIRKQVYCGGTDTDLIQGKRTMKKAIKGYKSKSIITIRYSQVGNQ